MQSFFLGDIVNNFCNTFSCFHQNINIIERKADPDVLLERASQGEPARNQFQ